MVKEKEKCRTVRIEERYRERQSLIRVLRGEGQREMKGGKPKKRGKTRECKQEDAKRAGEWKKKKHMEKQQKIE